MRLAVGSKVLALLVGATSGAWGCELVTGGYGVAEGGAGGAGTGTGTSTGGGASGGSGGTSAEGCVGLPELRRWDFEGPDALDGLMALGALGGEAQGGQLVFDYAGATPGPGGRRFMLPAGTSRASVCLQAQWDSVFASQTMLLSSLELTWTSGEYCGFFLALTNAGALQLFAIATVGGNQVGLADEQGSLVAAGTWQSAELFVDPLAGAASARLGQAEVSVDWAGAGFDQCPAEPSNVTLTVGSDLSAPGDVVLTLDDLVLARAID